MRLNLASILSRKSAPRFAVSGLLITGLHVFVAASLIEAGLLSPALANGLAFFVATVASYLLNTKWSFSSPLQGGSFFRFLVVSLIGITISMLMATITETMGLHYMYGIAFIVCIIPSITFVMHSYWTYR